MSSHFNFPNHLTHLPVRPAGVGSVSSHVESETWVKKKCTLSVLLEILHIDTHRFFYESKQLEKGQVKVFPGALSQHINSEEPLCFPEVYREFAQLFVSVNKGYPATSAFFLLEITFISSTSEDGCNCSTFRSQQKTGAEVVCPKPCLLQQTRQGTNLLLQHSGLELGRQKAPVLSSPSPRLLILFSTLPPKRYHSFKSDHFYRLCLWVTVSLLFLENYQ